MRIGIDLGGTKIEAIALMADGTIAARRRIASPRGDYGATIVAVRNLTLALEAECLMTGTIGIGMPGAICPHSGVVKNANSTWLNGHPFDRDMAAALGRPVRIENDANCFALSEAKDGAAAGASVVFGVILGTGCGGGIVVRGEILKGANAIAGEWGHNPLPSPRGDEAPGPACYCGRHGCLETFLSGPGLAASYARSGGALQTSAEEIAARAADGEEIARKVLADHTDRLARGLAAVINILDPDAIVLGGGLSRIDMLYPALQDRLGTYVFSPESRTPVLPPRHGDASGVRGAAWLWPID